MPGTKHGELGSGLGGLDMECKFSKNEENDNVSGVISGLVLCSSLLPWLLIVPECMRHRHHDVPHDDDDDDYDADDDDDDYDGQVRSLYFSKNLYFFTQLQ